MADSIIGAPLDRVDGRLKVTGSARYTAEMPVEHVAYGYLVTSTIASGRIVRLDTAEAEKAPGVLLVMTPSNAMRLPEGGRAGVNPPQGRVLTLLQDERVHYNGQPIAVVVADTFEHARDAAALVRATYAPEPAVLDFQAALPSAYPPGPAQTLGQQPDSRRGDVDAALARSAVRVDAVYTTPYENHNPMEPHNSLAYWEASPGGDGGERLVVYDSTQGVWPCKRALAKTFGLPLERVRVVSYFIGGGFGSKGQPWSHVPLAAMAAKQLGRPVKLVLSRRQMFGPVGQRPNTHQHVVLGAAHDGSLLATRHESTSHTSAIEDWLESCALVTRSLYRSETCETKHRLVKLNLGTPTFMRAPGEATGMFALESALDELAYELGMDPVALRLKNYADVDPEGARPFSSKSLRQCYEEGARRFGWARRSMAPRSMRDGDMLVGWGMASCTRPARTAPASAIARLRPDGRAVVRVGSQDIGTGTYTIITQVAADALGLPVERVRLELGDSDFPEAPVSAGSMTAAAVGTAVHWACVAAREKAARTGLPAEALVTTGPGGRPLSPGAEEGQGQRHTQQGGESQPYSMHSFGAVFVEARVDPELGIIRIPRITGAYAAGRILNAKTARSQMLGAIVYALGQTLFEHTLVDPVTGRIANSDLAEYHVPSNADVGTIDVALIDEVDPHINAIGVKGLGELAMTGVAAAVANAVYHATGKRVRELPITLDKLL